MLEDGTYDAVVVDATDDDGAVVVVELALLSGSHKGEVVTVRADGLGRDALDLLAVPATVTVSAGEPTLQLEG